MVATKKNSPFSLAANLFRHRRTKKAQTKPESYLALKNVVKQYGIFKALRGVSLDIQEGEFVCVVGPSGCGKTTLLRAIAGLDYQTSGKIIQNGIDISREPPSKRDFGIVFQSYALFPNLTVAENITFGLNDRSLSRRDKQARMQELLGLIDLRTCEHKYPGELSGGQQQRVALARALATSPGLLLLDEPLSALDAQVRRQVRQEIKAVQSNLGVTTLMVTHDQDEAMAMADRIVVMNHGKIEQIGSPEDVYQKPVSAFVASFIGRMNLLPCRISGPQCVEFEGLEIKCAPHALLERQPALLAVRSEDILLISTDSSVEGKNENAFDAVVCNVEFCGSFAEVLLDIDGATSLKATFSMHLMRESSISSGTVLRICLPVDLLQVYPEN